jgi:Ca-activated chloride channel homolog
MQRWQLTIGLGTIALAAAFIAPRLAGIGLPQPATAPLTPDSPPVSQPHHSSLLEVTAGLDHDAVLRGQAQERFLVVNITGPEETGRSFRRPVDMAVVIDASGSMSARGKIDYAKRAAKLIASEMTPEDTFSLITFNDEATTIISGSSPVQDPALIHRQIDRIYEGGGTNLFDGMSRGASEVERVLDSEAVGRVVILSDGHANVGVTDPASLSRYAASIATKGVAVSTIGLGLDYNEDLLADMADLSGGTYDFVDDPSELEAVFADELDRTASLVARDTTVTLQLPDGIELLEVIGWNSETQGRDVTVPLGNVYAGETRKIIARVRVTTTSDAREISVASVRANYHDIVENTDGTTLAEAKVSVTNDAADVANSVHRKRAVDANSAYGNWYLDESTRAYASGDVASSQALLRKGSNVLNTASRQLGAPELADEADDLNRQEVLYDAYTPSSDEGKRAIKGGKEKFRGRAR